MFTGMKILFVILWLAVCLPLISQTVPPISPVQKDGRGNLADVHFFERTNNAVMLAGAIASNAVPTNVTAAIAATGFASSLTANSGLNFQVFGTQQNQTLALLNTTTGLYNVLTATGADTAPSITLAPGSVSPAPIAGGNFWIYSRALAIKNTTTGNYCTLVCSGADGQQTTGFIFGSLAPAPRFVASYGIITNALGVYNLTTGLTNVIHSTGVNGVQTIITDP